MENKEVTKKILAENGINVPEGTLNTSLEEAVAAFDRYEGKSIVIKPKSTNFGLGISIIVNNASKEDFKDALTEAFQYDTSVLIEKYIPGKEYRFLVIGDEVVAVLHRVPANVTGDGIHTIRELVVEKNRDPLRGTGYKTPLEKLKTGREEVQFLKTTGKYPDDIPAKGEQVFLRKNSNISTGGDSIDYTETIPDFYKKIAVKASKAVGAKICGADIIINDIEENHEKDYTSGYGVIELNFNPAIHIHEFPWKGEKRFSEKKILKLLGF
jgi:glutamate--cysteine ligase